MGAVGRPDFPHEAAKKAKLFLPDRYDVYQDKQNPRTCFLKYDGDHNVLILVDDATKETLDIFSLDDMIGASVEVEMLGSEEPRVSKAAIFQNSPVQSPSTPADAGIFRPIGEDKEKIFTVIRADNAPKSSIPFDTQAAAKLTLFCYPRKDPSQDSFLSSCSGSSMHKAITNINQNSKAENLLHRYACHHTFQLAPAEDFEHISSLVKAIRYLVHPSSIGKLLILVNPHSGRKKGLEIFKTVVAPMLDQAGISYDSIVTTHAGHAEEVMAPRGKEGPDGISDVSKYRGLVAIGGDGSMHEIMQGLQRRTDGLEILRNISLGHIGAGTSNGLSATLAYASQEKFTAVDYSFLVAKGKSVPMDLSRYETKSNNYLSFLTFTWSLIADIDIESEALRWMGWLRMEIYTVWRVLNLRRYDAKITYLPASAKRITALPPLSTELNEKDGWITLQDQLCLVWVSQVTHAGEEMLNHPQSRPDDGLFHIFLIRANISRFRLLLILLGLETGSHVSMKGVEFIECSAYRFEPISEGSYNDLDGEVIESGPVQGIVIPSATNAYCNPP